MDGYTWYHYQHSARMKLVPELVHKKGHIGGEAIEVECDDEF
ncbi:HNH endonuclease [Pseudomonas poae]|uniref:HNH endonuclease n=1 Tax=Pseudomonas poae TaxID=200451 RepID=A0A7M1KQ69_9PSED|nr:HNH endonuclease [Pseudomonas poae]